jgi:hypothetical protein
MSRFAITSIALKYARVAFSIFLYAIFSAAFVWIIFGASELFAIWILIIFAFMNIYVLPSAWRGGVVDLLLAIISMTVFGILLYFVVNFAILALGHLGWQGGYILKLVA